MRELIVSVHPALDDPGSTIVVADHLPLAEYHVGQDVYALVDGVDYDIVLTNTGEAILVTGMARATAQGECARCLAPVTFDLAGEVEGYYLLSSEASPVDDREEDEFDFVGPDETIDLTDAVLAALVIETPLVLLCREDCAGLCPRCGHDLNEGPCDCPPEEPADDPVNPFAVLKDLDLGGGEER